MIGTTAALLGSALLGAGSSVGGALINRGAASGASKAQIEAANQARQYIQSLLEQYNPPIGTTAQTAADLVLGKSGEAQQTIRDALAQNRADLIGENGLLTPYIGLGTDTLSTLKTLMAPGGELNRTFNFQDIQNLDPGYQFRMDQASKALQSSAAAKGGALGGGTLQALSNLNQNLASAEAQNAFSRLTQQQRERFDRLNTLLGTGYQAASGAGQLLTNQNLTGAQNIGQFMISPAQWAGTTLVGATEEQARNAMEAGRSISNLMTGAGNAQAAGIVGGANALSAGLGGVAGAAGDIFRYYQDQNTLNQLKDIFKNPAVIQM